ncbi:MAG: DNA/RNA nuclease SfsA [Xenococcaceae cyanobacterium MO_167.B52]|nr:DNA/RNA nuclease SfsA [Xenococcaceae cyanobacterium MO_167.B52]
MKQIYQYPPLISGKLIKRYKRFLADIELETGEIITAHCPNTGPMIGVSDAGSWVQVSKSDNPKRKLAYTWEMIQIDNSWVGVNTSIPNRVIKIALEKKLLPQLASEYNQVRKEVPYGRDKKSRIDFLLTGEDSQLPIYLEVKSVTLAQDNVALFPDTVTTRGQKHLRELMALLPDAKSVMLYFINRGDCHSFAPADNYDPTYGELLRQAIAKGVKILPLKFRITPQGIFYLGEADSILFV